MFYRINICAIILILAVSLSITLTVTFHTDYTQKDIIIIDTEEKHSFSDLTITTFNIFMYRNDDQQNINGNKSVRSAIVESGADIVLIQEDVFKYIRTNDGITVGGYERVIECKTHPHKRNSIGNSILVSKQYLQKHSIIDTKAIDVTQTCPTRRCAVFVKFDNGLSVANTHFCGGKHDDQTFINDKVISDSIANAKTEALHKMWRVFGNFTVIGGDFNGMSSEAYNLRLFESYPSYQRMSAANRKQFAHFFHTPHALLRQRGYCASYDETMVRKTAQIGPEINVPDWIYINSHNSQMLVKTVDVFETNVSDHNPVTVALSLPLMATAQSAQSRLSLLDGYYVLHSSIFYDFKCVEQISLTAKCTAMNGQIFLIKHANHTLKYYTIQSNQSKLFWTMSGASLSQNAYNGFDTQMFEFVAYKHESDTYNIKPKGSGEHLCVSNTDTHILASLLPRDGNNKFIVYSHVTESRRIEQRQSLISVDECIANIPLIQTFVAQNVIHSTHAIYFRQRTPQEIANYTRLGYDRNVPSNAIKFVIDPELFSNKSSDKMNGSAIAYHGVSNPQSYDSILLKREGLKGFVYRKQKSLKKDLGVLGHIVFLTPSYILASTAYATLYTFEDFVYSLTLQVRVDVSQVMDIFHNTVPHSQNVDPNISDEEMEWVTKAEGIQIIGLIVKKYTKQDSQQLQHTMEHFKYWRDRKLDGMPGYV